MQNDSKTNMSIDERVKEDSDYRKYVRMPSQDAYRQTRKVIENCHMEEKNNYDVTKTNSNDMSDSQKFRQMEEKELSKYLDDNLVEFKLSHNTFKKTVLKKQEDHKKELLRQASERKINSTLFNKTDVSRCNVGKNPSKIGNMTFTMYVQHRIFIRYAVFKNCVLYIFGVLRFICFEKRFVCFEKRFIHAL